MIGELEDLNEEVLVLRGPALLQHGLLRSSLGELTRAPDASSLEDTLPRTTIPREKVIFWFDVDDGWAEVIDGFRSRNERTSAAEREEYTAAPYGRRWPDDR